MWPKCWKKCRYPCVFDAEPRISYLLRKNEGTDLEEEPRDIQDAVAEDDSGKVEPTLEDVERVINSMSRDHLLGFLKEVAFLFGCRFITACLF